MLLHLDAEILEISIMNASKYKLTFRYQHRHIKEVDYQQHVKYQQ